MKLFIVFISLIFAPLFLQGQALPFPGPGGTAIAVANCTPAIGYSNCRQLTIDHTQIPSNQTNFPVTIWNGFTLGAGKIQNVSCFDVIFISDSTGTTLIPWEVESCNQATGVMVVHFLDAAASSTVDGKFYISYGNAAIVIAQNTGANGPTHVWDANYVRVYHLADNAATTTVVDSTATAVNGTSSSNTSAFQGAGELNGSFNYGVNTHNYFTAGNLAFTGATATWSIECWFKFTGVAPILVGLRNSTNAQPIIDVQLDGTTFFANFTIRADDSSGLTNATGATALNDGNWHHIVITRTSAKLDTLYVDAINETSATDTMTSGQTFDTTYSAFAKDIYNFNFAPDIQDEVRVSTVDRSANWITAEYNNQKPASTFITIGSEF